MRVSYSHYGAIDISFDLSKHLRCIPACLAITAFLLGINGLFCNFVQIVSPTAQGPGEFKRFLLESLVLSG